MELIDRRVLKNSFHCPDSYAFRKIDSAPTIDAVPVVRCHLCDSWEPFGCKQERGACEEWSDYEHGITRYTGRDDFCSSGKRKAEHEDFAVKRMDADSAQNGRGGAEQ